MDSNQNQPSEVKEGGARSTAFDLQWIAAFADLRSKDDSKTFARVNRGALRSIADRARAAFQALAARPPSMERGEAEGWRLVPVEPTEEMLFKGWKATGTVIIPAIRVAYAAMLAATPSPAPSVSPDEIKAAYMRGWNDRESDIIERAERILPAPSAVEMAGVDRDLVDAILAIGEVEWGATKPLSDAEHVKNLESSLRLTREHFGTEGDQPMHGVYMSGLEMIVAQTGTSPNSAQHARAMVGAWNELVRVAEAQSSATPTAGQTSGSTNQ